MIKKYNVVKNFPVTIKSKPTTRVVNSASTAHAHLGQAVTVAQGPLYGATFAAAPAFNAGSWAMNAASDNAVADNASFDASYDAAADNAAFDAANASFSDADASAGNAAFEGFNFDNLFPGMTSTSDFNAGYDIIGDSA